jgi:hypothetical protein
MVACPLLDDLFSWAAQQPSANLTTVTCNLVSNQSTFQGHDKNLVSYAEGKLTYYPSFWSGRFFVPPSFTANPGVPLAQYFSDRRYKSDPQSFSDEPFSADNTDPLHLSITSFLGTYAVSFHSPKWGFTKSFVPFCEAGVIYGIVDNVELVAISLCNRSSQRPPS